MAQKASRWIDIFEEFVKELRINSKEESSPDELGTPLVLWESQKRFLREVATGLDLGQRHFYCLKSRQLGITTVSLAIDVFWLSMNPGLTMAIVTENEKNREKNRTIVRRYIKALENYFEGDFSILKGKDNRLFMEFTNGSRIDWLVAGVRDKGTSWGEGEGYAAAHLTEVAAYGSAEGLESFEEAFAQTNPKRLFIYESTAKGFGLWHDKWKEALADPETKRAWFCGWWSGDTNRIERSDPRWLKYGYYPPNGDEAERIGVVKQLYGYKIAPEQLCWIRWRTEQGGDTEILRQNQPYTADEAFVMSGFSFFPTRQLTKDWQSIDQAPIDSEYDYLAYKYHLGARFFDIQLEPITDAALADEIELKVWEEPHPLGRYVIGADPAWGRNEHKDRHGLEVYRCFADRIVQVAEYATNRCEAKQFAWVLAHIAGAYRNCLVNIDIQGPGQMIMAEWDHVRALLNSEHMTDEVRSRDWEDALGFARWYLYHRPDSMGAGYSFNFMTNSRTKPEIMHQMKGGYLTREIKIRSKALLEEMRNVIQDGDKIEAPESSSEDCKDDRVFATALANRTWIDWTRREMMAEGLFYDFVMANERGENGQMNNRLNAIVGRFFATAEERAMEAPTRPAWLSSRGL